MSTQPTFSKRTARIPNVNQKIFMTVFTAPSKGGFFSQDGGKTSVSLLTIEPNAIQRQIASRALDQWIDNPNSYNGLAHN